MSSVEDKIVAMKFDNKQFESGAKESLSTLDKLKAALNFSSKGKGLADIQHQANRFSLSNVANAIDGIGSKFTTASIIAISALASITAKAVDAGLRITKALTIAPLSQGFQEYELQLNAVQTILANTSASGATLKDVNKTLDQLNEYSDKTIYNFGEMAKNIGTFTAAGVDLDTATGSIKGIANLAALSGSNSQQASTAMYQLSQAISTGKVSLQDWNSVVNAGMGGTVFQRALAQTAEKMGTLDEGAVKLSGKMKNATINGKSFRESITANPGEQSWLTSKVLTETLKQFTGDMTDAELAMMGFDKAQIASIQKQAKVAGEAATKVKTFTQLLGTLQEAAGSGWAQTFEILIGDFEEAKKLWTAVNDVIGGFIGDSAKARNKMFEDFKKLGGRSNVLNGLINIFKAVVQVVKPIRDAFREIFPPVTGKQLFALSKSFLDFTKQLKVGTETLTNIKRTAKGFFALLSIGVSIVKGVLNVLGRLFGFVIDGSGGFLEITATIGDFLVKLDETIKKGDLVNKFFSELGKFLAVPIGAIFALRDAFIEFFRNMNENPFKILFKHLGRFRDRLGPLSGAADKVGVAWGGIVKIFKSVAKFLEPVIDVIKKTFSGIGKAIGEAFKAGNFSSVYDALNTGLLAGIVLLINRFLKNGLKIDFGGGFVESIRTTFGALTDTLTAMQNQVQAKTLLLIAGAVALLTVSIVALSLIDSDKLTKSLAAIGVAFGQLLLAMGILTKISASGGFLKIPFIAASMILLSTAVLILAAAVKVLSTMNWEELAKGLLGVAALLAMLVGFSAGLNKSSGAMVRAGLAMIPLAIGIKILASAVKDFATMNWADMAKGLTALATSLLIIAGTMQLMPANMLLTSAGLLVTAVALNILSVALQSMGGMTWEEIAKGLVTLAGSLVILAAGLYLMTGTLPGAAALLVAAVSLMALTPVLLAMSGLSWEEIAKGMVTLAGSLVILAAGLYLMTGTIGGAAALGIAAAALAVLAPVLLVLGTMSWEAIGKGLAAIAGAFLVLGLAGLVLTPVVPMILALSVALLLLGVAMSLIGVGILAVATGFSIFAAAGLAGIAVLSGMIALIPMFMSKFAEGIIGFITTLASQGAKFTAAFASLLNSLLDALILVIPKIGDLFNVLIKTAITILNNNTPRVAAAGLKLIIAVLNAIRGRIGEIVTIATQLIVNFLNGVARNMGRVVASAVNLVVQFLNAMGREIPRLADAGAKLVISFVNGVAGAIRNNSAAMGRAGANLASAVISGMASGLSAGVGQLASRAADMARSALAAAKSALGINSPSTKFFELGKWSDEGLADGLLAYTGIVEKSAEGVATTAMDAVKKTMNDLSTEVANHVDTDPVIRPVLDLTQITRDASLIGGMLDQKALAADISYRQALGVATIQPVAKDEGDDLNSSGGDTILKFEQHNNSPKALSAAEIYRDTKSVLALAKEALKK